MFFLISWYWEPEVFLVIFIIRPVYSSRFSFLFKVTVHLQGCRASKRCSASGLNCRYLNPYIKGKLIGLAIRLYQKCEKKNELSNFSRLLNASARITLWKLHVKVNFVFLLFNVFLRFQGQSAKKPCLRFSEKLQNIFEIGLKKNMKWS